MSANNPNVLDFDALVSTKRSIKIDGIEYPMLDPIDFSLDKQVSMNKASERIQALMNSANTGNLQAARTALEKFIHEVVPSMPRSVVIQLQDFKKVWIMNFFMRALQEINESGNPKEVTAQAPTSNQEEPEENWGMDWEEEQTQQAQG